MVPVGLEALGLAGLVLVGAVSPRAVVWVAAIRSFQDASAPECPAKTVRTILKTAIIGMNTLVQFLVDWQLLPLPN